VDLAVIVAIDFVHAIATLALISLGLAIVFGMMRIINLARGLAHVLIGKPAPTFPG
jgi:branched-subunit amino acid ABC-type transport system permease component